MKGLFKLCSQLTMYHKILVNNQLTFSKVCFTVQSLWRFLSVQRTSWSSHIFISSSTQSPVIIKLSNCEPSTIKQYRGYTFSQKRKLSNKDSGLGMQGLTSLYQQASKFLANLDFLSPSISLGVSQCRYFSVRRKDYRFPEVLEEDLEENFVRGSGPGGQNVNQTANCVVLKHKPTGLVVKCHTSRSLDTNRKQARTLLQEKLDFYLHGENSFQALSKAESRLHKQEKKRKTKDRLAMKREFKEREGLE